MACLLKDHRLDLGLVIFFREQARQVGLGLQPQPRFISIERLQHERNDCLRERLVLEKLRELRLAVLLLARA